MKIALCLLLLLSAVARAEEIAPFKDKMFRNNKILQKADKGNFLTIDYREKRDVNGRDEIPVKKAKDERVDLAALKEQRDIKVTYGSHTMESTEVGTPQGAKFAMIFIHGAGGDKSLGTNDWTFGGNFNRLKNMAVNSGGLFYSPSVTFDETGALGVEAIMDKIKAASPDAKIVVACGSAGGDICNRLAQSKSAVAKLAGIVEVGSAVPITDVEKSAAFSASVPIVYAHGKRDPVVAWDIMHAQYKKLGTEKKGYPTRFLLYNKGNHGTPIRLIDWRETLNWIYAQPKPVLPKEENPAKQKSIQQSSNSDSADEKSNSSAQ